MPGRRLEQHTLQRLELGACRAFGPNEARAAALRPVAQTLEREGKALKSGNALAQSSDRGWYRGLVPWWDESEVDIIGSHAPERNAVDPLC